MFSTFLVISVEKLTFAEIVPKGAQDTWKGMEYHWFNKHLSSLAARVRKTGFPHKSATTFSKIQWKIDFSREKLEIHEIPPFCTSPNPCANQWFNVCLEKKGVWHGHPHPILQKVRNSSPFSIPAPESALFRPESVLREPGSKPFINTRFWEVFWRPGTGKVHFLPKNQKLCPKTRNPRKSVFGPKMCNFGAKAANLPKRYLFCLF